MKTLPGTSIELISGRRPTARFRSALFDFDGTLSVIREGWQGVMIPYMVEVLAELKTGESLEELENVVREYVERLTGKQTIYQMIELTEQIKKRGGTPKDPLYYKHAYLEHLWQRIKDRVAGLKEGRIQPDEMLIEGSRKLLEELRARGVELYLASGTDEDYVIDEAAALGLTPYFGSNIFGALDNYKAFSKEMVIERILKTHGLKGESLVTFGDGFVEIENCRAVGGYAVGVASNEVLRRGVDNWKRNRLIQAGADIIITDYREVEALIAFLFPEDALS